MQPITGGETPSGRRSVDTAESKRWIEDIARYFVLRGSCQVNLVPEGDDKALTGDVRQNEGTSRAGGRVQQVPEPVFDPLWRPITGGRIPSLDGHQGLLSAAGLSHLNVVLRDGFGSGLLGVTKRIALTGGRSRV